MQRIEITTKQLGLHESCAAGQTPLELVRYDDVFLDTIATLNEEVLIKQDFKVRFA